VSLEHFNKLLFLPQPFYLYKYQNGDFFGVRLEVALLTEEANAFTANGISLARLAFGPCHPGQTPTNEQLQPLVNPIPLNPGNRASLKRLIFESQTLVCNEVKLKTHRKEDSAQTTFAGPERDARVQQRKYRLTGLTSKWYPGEQSHHNLY